jgi:hypothetical protein
MMRGLFAILAVGYSLGLAACTTVQSITVNQIPEKRFRRDVVKAHDWSPIILAIPFGSGFVDKASAQLARQCQRGAVEGVLTKFETTDYFLGLYAVQSIDMEGYCVPSANSRKQANVNHIEIEPAR